MKEACSASLDWKLDGASVCTMDIGSYPHGREEQCDSWRGLTIQKGLFRWTTSSSCKLFGLTNSSLSTLD